MLSEDKYINEIELLPHSVQKILQQLQRVAYEGLVDDKIIFTLDDLPDICRNDPSCHGLLQSVESYNKTGTPSRSFNFLHLGIQEFFAAQYVASLSKDKVDALLQESFLVDSDSEQYFMDEYYLTSISASKIEELALKKPNTNLTLRLASMWIMYCGITKGQSESLKQHLLLLRSYRSKRQAFNKVETIISDNGSLKVDMNYMKNHPVKLLYLFQCFQEAQDPTLCFKLINDFGSVTHSICVSGQRLYPYQVVSLGIFLSKSHRDWAELNLFKCYIGDNGISLLHRYVCTDNKLNISTIDLSQNKRTAAASPIIGSFITHLQPSILMLGNNCINNIKDISVAVMSTNTVKALGLWDNNLTSQEAPALRDMITCLEHLFIQSNKLGDDGAIILSEGIAKSKSLKEISIDANEISIAGAKAIAKAFKHNTSLEILYISNNPVSQMGIIAIVEAIAANKDCHCAVKSQYSSW